MPAPLGSLPGPPGSTTPTPSAASSSSPLINHPLFTHQPPPTRQGGSPRAGTGGLGSVKFCRMSEAFSDPPSPRGALPHPTAGQRPPLRGAVTGTRTHESHRSPNTLTRTSHQVPCVFCSKSFTFISLFHFTKGKTKAQRGQVTCPNTQLVSPDLGFSPGSGPGGHAVHTSVLREENAGGRLVSTLARAASGVS